MFFCVIKPHYLLMRFFIFSLLFNMTALAAENDSRLGKWGLRLTGGVGAYAGGIDNSANRLAADAARVEIAVRDSVKKSISDYTKYFSAGWLSPIQLEGTYGLTNKFEILLGIRYGFSGSLQGDDKYIIDSFGTALGYRCYFSTQSLIQAYISGQVAIDLTKFTHLEGKSALGFLFAIDDRVGVFVEGSSMIAGLYNSDNAIGKGLQFGAGLGAGVNVRF
jgi:hypothetical protein